MDRLCLALRHRGPEGFQRFEEGAISLAHGMLVTTPEAERERQPVVDRAARCAIVFDGRLDNRQDLIAALGMPPGSLSRPDSELVLAAYARWHDDTPTRLLGDFAFAVWDGRRGELFCARDPVGARSLAYFCSGEFFAFASEAEALVHLPSVSAAPNELRIANLLVRRFRNLGDRKTWHQQVEALLPGESMRVSLNGTKEITKYWVPDVSGNRRYASYAECEEHFLEVFRQAVEDRLRSTSEIAMMLSGGLDSAALLAMSRRITAGGGSINAYSAIDDAAEACIESRSIMSLAESNGASLHTVSVPSMRGMVGVEDLYRAAWSRAHPVANSILLPQLMCQAAGRDGRSVLLHGACGDLASQAPRYYPSALIRQGRLMAAWRESRAASAHNLFLQGSSASRIYLHSAARSFAPEALKRRYRGRRFKREALSAVSDLISPEFVARMGLPERMREEYRRGEQRRQANPRRYGIEHCIEYVSSGMSGFNLVAGRYGVETRDPWSDIRVLDFMFRLPDEYKNRFGWTKYPVRSAFKNEIEPFVRERRDKTHVGWKMVTRALEAAHPELSEKIDNDLALVEPFIDIPAFRSRARSFVRQHDLSDYLVVFEIMSLQYWLNRVRAL